MRRGSPVTWKDAGLPTFAIESLYIHVQGNRSSQDRTLAAEPVLTAMMLAWLEVRVKQLNSDGPLPSSPLFPSRKGMGRLSAKTLFVLASAHVRETLRDDFTDEQGNLSLAHGGPMILRNACLARWLEAGTDPGLVAQWGGLKDTESLHRLRRGS